MLALIPNTGTLVAMDALMTFSDPRNCRLARYDGEHTHGRLDMTTARGLRVTTPDLIEVDLKPRDRLIIRQSRFLGGWVVDGLERAA